MNLRWTAPFLLALSPVAAGGDLILRATGTVTSINGTPPASFSGAQVGEEIEVLMVNERDEDLRVYAVPPEDCGGDLQSTAWTVLAGGVGTVSLPEDGVYHMVPVGALNETRGCFTATPDLTVRIPADR